MIIWIFNHYAEGPNGQATRHFDLGKVLVQRGHEVTIIASNFSHHSLMYNTMVMPDMWDYLDADGSGDHVATLDGVCFVFLNVPPYTTTAGANWARLQYGRYAMEWARKHPGKPDVIVGVTAHMIAAATAQRIALRLDVPFVYEVTDVWPRMLVESGRLKSPIWLPLRWWMGNTDKKLAQAAQAIVGYWPNMGRHYGLWTTPITHFVPHAVDLNRYPITEPHKYDGTFRIAYTGSISAYYDIDVVLDTQKALEARGVNNVEFLLVGDGEDKERLVERVVVEKIPRIVFMEPVPKVKIPCVLSGVDATIFTMKPMKIHEELGLSGNKISDYAAAGKPILLSTVADIYPPEITNGDVGLRSRQGSMGMATHIQTLLNMGPDVWQRMGGKARKIAEECYAVPKVAEQYEDILRQAIR